MTSVSPDSTQPLVVYLDLNHWYALGAARVGRPDQLSDVELLAHLRQLRREGAVLLPLSAIHYTELRENPRDHLTAEAADVMEELSDFWTLAPMSVVLAEEIDTQLNERFGKPEVVRTTPKIGRGFGFAHGEAGSFHITGSESMMEALRLRLGDEGIRQLEASANATFEHLALRAGRKVPGFNPYVERDQAELRLARILRVVDNLKANPDLYRRLDDVVAAGELAVEIREEVRDALVRADDDPYAIATQFTESKEQMSEMLLNMPSRRVSVSLFRGYHRNLTHNWKVNDLRDIDALSIAVPYCDIVVTDNAVRTAIAHAHLDRTFATTVLSQRTELAKYLPTLEGR